MGNGKLKSLEDTVIIRQYKQYDCRENGQEMSEIYQLVMWCYDPVVFQGTVWKRATICTALFFLGTLIVVYYIMSMVLLEERSSEAVFLGTFFTLLFLWICVSVPLLFLSGFFGYKKEAPTHHVRTNQILDSSPRSNCSCALLLLPYWAASYPLVPCLWSCA